jgi:glycosyltransferase involved in cell wall biosynthesis
VNPRVSFIIACYNYGRYVGEAIDTLLAQRFDALEIIAIDDCSTDDSRRVLERYAADEPRVRVAFHERNQGHIRTYNEGLAMARGEFMAIFGADDFALRDDAVADQVAIFDANPRVGFVYGAHTYVDENGTPFRTFQPWGEDYVRDGLTEFADLAFQNYVPHSGTLVRRACHEAVGDYDPALPHAGDWELWLRIAGRYQVGYVAEPLYAYRVHGRNMSVARYSPQHANGEVVMAIAHGFDALPPDAPAELRGLRSAAIRQALLATTWGDRSLGRVRRSWEGLLDAARREPGLLASRQFYGAAARTALLTLVGHQRYQRLSRWRDAQPKASFPPPSPSVS